MILLNEIFIFITYIIVVPSVLFIGFFMLLAYIHIYILPNLGSLIKLRKKMVVNKISQINLNLLAYLLILILVLFYFNNVLEVDYYIIYFLTTYAIVSTMFFYNYVDLANFIKNLNFKDLTDLHNIFVLVSFIGYFYNIIVIDLIGLVVVSCIAIFLDLIYLKINFNLKTWCRDYHIAAVYMITLLMLYCLRLNQLVTITDVFLKSVLVLSFSYVLARIIIIGKQSANIIRTNVNIVGFVLFFIIRMIIYNGATDILSFCESFIVAILLVVFFNLLRFMYLMFFKFLIRIVYKFKKIDSESSVKILNKRLSVQVFVWKVYYNLHRFEKETYLVIFIYTLVILLPAIILPKIFVIIMFYMIISSYIYLNFIVDQIITENREQVFLKLLEENCFDQAEYLYFGKVIDIVTAAALETVKRPVRGMSLLWNPNGSGNPFLNYTGSSGKVFSDERALLAFKQQVYNRHQVDPLVVAQFETEMDRINLQNRKNQSQSGNSNSNNNWRDVGATAVLVSTGTLIYTIYKDEKQRRIELASYVHQLRNDKNTELDKINTINEKITNESAELIALQAKKAKADLSLSSFFKSAEHKIIESKKLTALISLKEKEIDNLYRYLNEKEEYMGKLDREIEELTNSSVSESYFFDNNPLNWLFTAS